MITKSIGKDEMTRENVYSKKKKKAQDKNLRNDNTLKMEME